MISKKFVLKSAAVLALAAVSAPAMAVGTIWLSTDGTNYTKVATDAGAGDLNPSAGLVSALGTFNGWQYNTTGSSYPAISTPQKPSSDLFSFTLSGAAGSIWVWYVNDGYDLGGAATGKAGIGGTTSGTVVAGVYYDDGNASDPNAFATFTQCTVLGPFSGGAFSGSSSCVLPADPAFSIGQLLRVTHTGAQQLTTLDFAFDVPEPGSLALLGFGLMGLGMVRRRKA